MLQSNNDGYSDNQQMQLKSLITYILILYIISQVFNVNNLATI